MLSVFKEQISSCWHWNCLGSQEILLRNPFKTPLKAVYCLRGGAGSDVWILHCASACLSSFDMYVILFCFSSLVWYRITGHVRDAKGRYSSLIKVHLWRIQPWYSSRIPLITKSLPVIVNLRIQDTIGGSSSLGFVAGVVSRATYLPTSTSFLQPHHFFQTNISNQHPTPTVSAIAWAPDHTANPVSPRPNNSTPGSLSLVRPVTIRFSFSTKSLSKWLRFTKCSHSLLHT